MENVVYICICGMFIFMLSFVSLVLAVLLCMVKYVWSTRVIGCHNSKQLHGHCTSFSQDTL